VLLHPVSATFVGLGQIRQQQLPFVGDLLSALFLFQPSRFFPCARGRLLFQQFLVPLLQIFRGPLFLLAAVAVVGGAAAGGAGGGGVATGRGSTQGADCGLRRAGLVPATTFATLVALSTSFKTSGEHFGRGCLTAGRVTSILVAFVDGFVATAAAATENFLNVGRTAPAVIAFHLQILVSPVASAWGTPCTAVVAVVAVVAKVVRVVRRSSQLVPGDGGGSGG
jgi:hypothetical protein